METNTFTPSEELLLETLVARYRLGENSWSFNKRFKSVLVSLEAKGYINFKSASVENTFLVWLSEKGREELLSFPYVIPLLAKYVKAEKFYESELENIELKKQLNRRD